MIGQINTHSIDFIKTGITPEQMNEQIDLIENNLESSIKKTTPTQARRETRDVKCET